MREGHRKPVVQELEEHLSSYDAIIETISNPEPAAVDVDGPRVGATSYRAVRSTRRAIAGGRSVPAARTPPLPEGARIVAE